MFIKLHKNAKDLTGRRFGRLVAIGPVGHKVTPGGQKFVLWLCKCDCGAEARVVTTNLLCGLTKSCGCYKRDRIREEKFVHGMKRSPEYRAWSTAKDRCYNPNTKNFADYGGRGIVMCDRWRDDFSAFYADMGPKPSPRHELDRIDVNGNYEPSNCRWADPFEQANNKRNNVWVEAFGKRQTVAQWARELGISEFMIHKRLKRGWSPEKALRTLPLRSRWDRRVERDIRELI